MFTGALSTRYVRTILAGLAILLCVMSAAALVLLTSPVEVQGFRQLGGEGNFVELDLSGGIYRFTRVSMPSQDPTLEDTVTNSLEGAEAAYAYSDLLGRIRVTLDEEFYNHANVIVIDRCVFYGFCRYLGYIELLRQSAQLLESKWSFAKPGGYTVVGRSTIPLPTERRMVSSTSTVSRPFDQSLPDFAEYYSSQDPPGRTREAIAIARYMWSRTRHLGPHNDRTPQTLGPLQRLDLLESGQWSTQCGDFQQIFVNLAAASPRLSGVRSVSLFQYYPIFPDLIPHSHAAVEVQLEGKKWVLIDPWFGLLFRYEGRLLSAGEIAEMSPSERKRITVRHVVPKRPFPFDLEHYEGTVPSDGYWGYFGTIITGPNETLLFSAGADRGTHPRSRM